MVVQHGAEGSGSILNACGLCEAVKGGASRGYRANLIKADRPLHTLDLELDTYISSEQMILNYISEIYDQLYVLLLYLGCCETDRNPVKPTKLRQN